MSHTAQDSQALWEEELKSRSKLGLRLAELEKEKGELSAQVSSDFHPSHECSHFFSFADDIQLYIVFLRIQNPRMLCLQGDITQEHYQNGIILIQTTRRNKLCVKNRKKLR